MCLEIDKENYEKLDHIWLAKKQYLLKTTLFTSVVTNISISCSRDHRQNKNKTLKLH